MGSRPCLFALHCAHLRPAVFQPVIFVLCSANRAPSCHLLEDIVKQVRFWEGDSSYLPLSKASRTGCRRGPFTDPRGRWLLFRLAGCMAAASRWSNPGQSLPNRMGMGRSFTIPTLTDQAPGVAEIVTRRAGTCRVSPCIHVIGRTAFVTLRGGRRWDWMRLTVLPESSRARNGCLQGLQPAGLGVQCSLPAMSERGLRGPLLASVRPAGREPPACLAVTRETAALAPQHLADGLPLPAPLLPQLHPEACRRSSSPQPSSLHMPLQ